MMMRIFLTTMIVLSGIYAIFINVDRGLLFVILFLLFETRDTIDEVYDFTKKEPEESNQEEG